MPFKIRFSHKPYQELYLLQLWNVITGLEKMKNGAGELWTGKNRFDINQKHITTIKWYFISNFLNHTVQKQITMNHYNTTCTQPVHNHPAKRQLVHFQFFNIDCIIVGYQKYQNRHSSWRYATSQEITWWKLVHKKQLFMENKAIKSLQGIRHHKYHL